MSETITSAATNAATNAATSAATAMRPGIAADMTGFVGIRLACTTALYRRLVPWPSFSPDQMPTTSANGGQRLRAPETVAMGGRSRPR